MRAVTQAALVGALLVGAGLRACALLAPALGVELDAAYPQHAVLSIAERRLGRRRATRADAHHLALAVMGSGRANHDPGSCSR